MSSTPLNDDTIRSEIVDFLHLLSNRNRKMIEDKSIALIAFLERGPVGDYKVGDYQGLLALVKGFVCYNKTNFKEAIEFFESGIAKSGSYPSLMGAHYVGLGFCQRSLGDLDQAVSHLYHAQELVAAKSQYRRVLVYTYHMLGEIYISIQEYDKALEYINKQSDLLGNNLQGMDLFRILNSLGQCYQHMRQYEKSKDYFTRALEVGNTSQEVVARGQNDLGVLFLQMKEYDEAESMLSSSLQIREETGLEDPASTSMLGLAEVYLARGRNKEAVDLLIRCKAITDKFQTKQKQVRLLQLLARAYSACGNYEQATLSYEQYNALIREAKSEQERKIFKLKNDQIEKQRQIIADKHTQLAATFEEVKRLKINRKSIYFSWVTVILLVLISEIFLDPMIEHLSYDNFLSLAVKVLIACLFKPIDGMYEKILWDRAMKRVA